MRHILLISIALFLLFPLFLCSCASIETPAKVFPAGYTGPAILDATPWETTLVSGSTGYIYVTVMDAHRNQMPGQTVTANWSSDGDEVATIDYNKGYSNPVTNEKGQAVFYVVGTGYPGNTKLLLSCGEASTSVYVWTQGNSPFEPPR
jgi:hypothetical protein